MDDERIRPFWNKRWELTAEEDCLVWGLRVVIPPPLRDAVLLKLHVAHPVMVKMKEVARSRVWWETIDRDIETLVCHCASCQQTRPVPRSARLTPWMWPAKPWHRVHADFANKEGQDFLVMVDAHSKWPEILPMSSTTAAATIAAFRDVFARFGFPVNVVTDNGPQFISAEFSEFLRRNGANIFESPRTTREQWCCRTNGAVIQAERRSDGQLWSTHETPSGSFLVDLSDNSSRRHGTYAF